MTMNQKKALYAFGSPDREATVNRFKLIEPLHILKKDGFRMKIQFDYIADDLIFSLIRDMTRNIAKGGRSYGGKLQETVPSYD